VVLNWFAWLKMMFLFNKNSKKAKWTICLSQRNGSQRT